MLAWGALMFGLAFHAPALQAHDNSVDDRVIKATSPERIESMRQALVQQIWGVPWSEILTRQPTRTTDHYTQSPADALPAGLQNLDRIEQVVTVMSEPQIGGSDVTHTSTAFIFHPKEPNGRIVIVHHGHGCALNGSNDRYNLDAAIRELVAAHFGVIAMRMPLFQRPSECGHDGADQSHDQLLQYRLRVGTPMKFFLEPVARVLNYVKVRHPIYREYDMMGLSGGGWTTTVYPAIDSRIKLSFPVAGSVPLYLRGHSYDDDLEQYLAGFYALAGYKDLYVMGSYGPGRKQVQILNRFDDCCFGEPQHTVAPPPYLEAVDAYALDVRTTLARLNAGSFVLVVSQTAHTHQIPMDGLQQVILPELGAPMPHDLEDDGTVMSDMHGCGSARFMRGVDASENKFLCMMTEATGQAIVDEGTQASFVYRGSSHAVHVCPEGYAMQGWHEAGNKLLCQRSVRAFSGAAFPDEASQAPELSSPGRSMHVCRGPDANSVMVGIHAVDNVLICRNVQ